MKLIVTGATGFVGSEVIRQALRHARVSSVVAVARKPVSLDGAVDTSKLKTIVIKDYAEYSDEAKKEFADADACIWTVAITPSKSKKQDPLEVKRVCQESTIAGLKAMHDAGPAKPFRFLYMSGVAAERDQSKTPTFMPEYTKMRGETENQVLAFAAGHKDEGFEASVAKPGLITDGSWYKAAVSFALKYTNIVPSVSVEEVAAAMLQQVVDGFEKDPLENADLIRLGKAAMQQQVKS
ncbi:hypothetical protein JX266_010905 [Neoarthrinium moseri]|nr:hypothetical protein JX266_010905 [Neoarthrinium moseri]